MVIFAVPSLLNSAVIFVGELSTSHLPRIKLCGLEPQPDPNRARHAAITMLNFALMSGDRRARSPTLEGQVPDLPFSPRQLINKQRHPPSLWRLRPQLNRLPRRMPARPI